jgi:hypothetical protein
MTMTSGGGNPNVLRKMRKARWRLVGPGLVNVNGVGVAVGVGVGVGVKVAVGDVVRVTDAVSERKPASAGVFGREASAAMATPVGRAQTMRATAARRTDEFLSCGET